MMGDHGQYGKRSRGRAPVHIPLVSMLHHLEVYADQLTGLRRASGFGGHIFRLCRVKIAEPMESMSLRPVVSGKCQSVREYGIAELVNQILKELCTALA